MDSITITLREFKQYTLGYDLIGKEYYIWDKINKKWFWFKSLEQANLKFNLFKGIK